ncbi:MAG: trigger factor, partial [Propionibacteriaceae bacterium]|nr:trigger factor [Propionibacteriaceae bacterium]
MPSTVEKLSPSRVKITVEVPFTELKPALDKAYRDIASQVNIPGFRAGKVPPLVIDQRFGRGMVLQEAINQKLPELYGQAIEDNQLNPLGEPEVEVTKLEDNELVEFTAEVDVRPEFEVPAFDTISVEVDAVTEADEDRVDEQIDLLRQRFSTLTDVERAAEDGDVVTIDLTGAKNGEELEEATAEGVQYKIGSGGMLDGLDDAVTGLSVGESASFSSELVGGPLRGETVDVTVTVQKVAVQELPEVDDEFAQLASEFDTVEEMKADLRTAVANMARLEQAADARDKVLEDLIGRIDIAVPEKLLAAEIDARHQQIQNQLAQAGLTLDQYLEDGEEEQTAEEFWADIDARSGDALKAQLVLDQVADNEQVGVAQEDLTQHIIRKAQQSGNSPEQEMQHMMEHNHMGEWMTEIRRGKALALIVEGANVTDSDGNPLDLKHLRGDGSMADPEDAESAESADS